MKISIKTAPVLQALDKRQPLTFRGVPHFEAENAETLAKMMYHNWRLWREDFKKNTYIISKQVSRSLQENDKKLEAELIKGNIVETNGAMLQINEGRSYLSCYAICACKPDEIVSDVPELEGMKRIATCQMWTFANSHECMAYGYCEFWTDGDSVFFNAYTTIPDEKLSEGFCEQCIQYALLEMFKKYAATETILVYNKTERNLPDGSDRIQNKSGMSVKFLDSRWLREIIRLEGFKVRGHFRIQNCKNDDGEWIKKLVYINEYQKHGYHRRALRDIQEL